MTETQRRIRAYKRALPHMKERVIAVALLLAMSISMMSSATFAWITLSTNPEASSLATTIVANGNLEIALSNTDGEEPDESAVGDGGQNVALSNLTWGNLINLSDMSYGLEHLVLRPATRNDKDLLNSPVNAVIYGADGRVVDYTTDFAYSNYDRDSKAFLVPSATVNGEVVNTTYYGVRAVSSVKYEDLAGNALLVAALDQLDKDFTDAQKKFQSIYLSDAYMKTVGYLVGVHVSYVLGDADVLVDATEVAQTKAIADVFYESMYRAGNVIVKMINLHQYLGLNDETINTYHEYTFPEVFMVNYDGVSKYTANNMDNALLNSYKNWIPAITTYQRAWTNTVNFYNGITGAAQKSQVYWAADMMSHVNLLCDMDTATLDGATASQMAADMVNYAADIVLGDANDHEAVLNDGALKDADQLLDGNMKVDSGKVEITVVVPESLKQKIKDKLGFLASMVPDVLTLKPEITTSAEPPALLITDYQTASQRASGGSNLKGVATAADTYAMAIDFWVRTNAQNSLLILEGELQTEEVVEKDDEGNPLLDDNGNPITYKVVTGYSGVNRVWDELDDPNTDAGALIYQSGGISMTQGSGSCYIFYADNPEQQSQSLNMLRAMRVAFIDDQGTLLNVAEMDVANAVEDGGRVIVPLQLGKRSEITLANGNILVDQYGEPVTRYIQPMPLNEAQRITALIYLDGELLSNSEVLEAGTIKGQLNIQFGTTDMKMEPQKDGELIKSYYTIDFAQKSYEFDAYDPDNCAIELKMMLEGNRPSSVKGNFLSIINEHQGARQETFTMQMGEDGYWTAIVPFSGPGNYELRSIQLDGVDIALKSETIVSVKIDGIAVNNLNCTGSWPSGAKTHQVRTADTYYQQAMTLSIASTDRHNVRGIFIGDNGQNVSINFAYQDGGMYEGTAGFTSSGTYKLTYLEIDGTVSPLPESMYKTITLQLGLKAYVTIGTPVLSSGHVNEDILKNVAYDPKSGWSFVYTCEEPLNMPVNVVIMDDQNRKLTALEGLELYYGAPGAMDVYPDTDLTWDYTTGSYVGEFVDFNRSGIYQFRYVKLDATNYISVAASAPNITSIPPEVTEYVPQAAYEPLTFEWGATRNLQIQLKNGAAARIHVELTQGEGADATTHKMTINNNGNVDENKITTFTIPVPNDGLWKITGLEVDTVFAKTEEYPDGKFFSGAEYYDEDGVTVIGYDRLDLTDTVLEDNIGTYFLTKVDITVNNAPTNYSGSFMADHQANGMTISVNNQGKPLATVLREVAAKFPDANINSEVIVGMTYTWDENSTTYGISGTNLPAHTFGSDNLTLNDKNVYAMGDMNFKLAGKYYTDFTLIIGGVEYTGTIPDALTDGKYVGVTWNVPVVTIGAYSPQGTFTTKNAAKDNVVSVTPSKNGNTVNVFTHYQQSGRSATLKEEAQVELLIANTGLAEKAAMEFTAQGGAVYMYTNGSSSGQTSYYTWDQGVTSCYRYIGKNSGACSSTEPAGTLTASSVALTFGGVEYTFSHTIITINHRYP